MNPAITPISQVAALVDEVEAEALQKQIESTAAWLREKASLYYKDGTSDVSDEEYDRVHSNFEAIAPEHPFFNEVGALPSQDGRLKITHQIPMLSLNKATTRKELQDWLNRAPEEDYVVIGPKIDGASAELYYKGGLLKWAATRGDGVTGEDVTVAARKAIGVPVKVPYEEEFWVRGEIFLPKSKWAEVDPEMKTNPRNVGTGILNRMDGSDAEKLHFLALSCCGAREEDVTETQQACFMTLQGFQVVELNQVVSDLATVEAAIDQLRVRRPNLEYAIDGAVIKFDSLLAQRMLGVSSGRPRGQIAFKWPSDTVETVITGVILTVGHTGYIAPTAQLEPVQLMGVTVSNALLNNWDEIERLGVAIGDTVLVERSGEIIPKIIGVTKRPEGRQPLLEPTTCPECGGPCGRKKSVNATLVGKELTGQLQKDFVAAAEKGGALTYCLSDDCPSRLRGVIKRWIKSLNILGIGDDILDAMFHSGLVRKRLDLYTVRQSDLAAVRVGNGVLGFKRADAIKREVEKTHLALSITQFIGSLGVPYLGVRKAAIMHARSEGALTTLEGWTDDTLLTIGEKVQAGGTAPVMHAAIQKNLQEIRSLAYLTLKAEADLPAAAPAPVALPAGKMAHTFLLTGKFDQKKSHYHDLITAAGHKFEEDFTKIVTHLVQADPSSASSKTKKATKAGIPVIGIDELVSLIS